MATIDKLDLSVYNLYALRTQMREQINIELRLDQASQVSQQTIMQNFDPQIAELSLLLGMQSGSIPWAYFFPPKKFRERRRSPFTFARILPSFQSEEDIEHIHALLGTIDTPYDEEKSEKQMISNCLKKITEINDWMSHIVGRVGQFLQG